MLRVQAMTLGELTLTLITPLRTISGKLTPPALQMQVSDILIEAALTDGPYAITRVDWLSGPDGHEAKVRVLKLKDVQPHLASFLRELFDPFVSPDEHNPAPTPIDGGGVNHCAGDTTRYGITHVGIPASDKVEVYAPVVFTVSLKVRGVEKARVTAKTPPRT